MWYNTRRLVLLLQKVILYCYSEEDFDYILGAMYYRCYSEEESDNCLGIMFIQLLSLLKIKSLGNLVAADHHTTTAAVGMNKVLLFQNQRGERQHQRFAVFASFASTVILAFVALLGLKNFAMPSQNLHAPALANKNLKTFQDIIPPKLLGLYKEADFINVKRTAMPYWEELHILANNSTCTTTLSENDRSKEQWIEEIKIDLRIDSKIDANHHFGPCYLDSKSHHSTFIQSHKSANLDHDSNSSFDLTYPHYYDGVNPRDLSNMCRPGFIIIGAGKCGTSSLYHYLTGHPRVLPAKQKQTDYFKNITHLPMAFYLTHFPDRKSFLSKGALMTGEASPGYLPRPDVAFDLQNMMKNQANNGPQNSNYDTTTSPKIITLVRDPLERSWSSYNYNYVRLAKSQIRSINATMSPSVHLFDDEEEIVKNYLFSFEEMVREEIKVLKQCLKRGGRGETLTQSIYEHKPWASKILKQKHDHKGIPLIALDEACYGDTLSPTVPRRQWKDLVDQYPHKIINLPNIHVVQSIVGRSLYTFPLEWWYALYSRDDLYVVCNEELKHNGSIEMSKVSDFLGLPTFDFSGVLEEGMFNVGGNVGYDTITKWNPSTIREDLENRYGHIPISEELKRDYLEFVQPFNERLFQLIGKRCAW